jgi:hypothetical protein
VGQHGGPALRRAGRGADRDGGRQAGDVDGSFHAQITSVEQTYDAASVTLAEEGFWGTVSFVDFFSLARIDGTWKIVNKTFVHTGGEPPAIE